MTLLAVAVLVLGGVWFAVDANAPPWILLLWIPLAVISAYNEWRHKTAVARSPSSVPAGRLMQSGLGPTRTAANAGDKGWQHKTGVGRPPSSASAPQIQADGDQLVESGSGSKERNG